MTLVLAIALAALAEYGLQSVHLWMLVAACRPLLLVVVGHARRWDPVRIGWLGLAVGLISDAIALRPLGPGAIAGAAGGVIVAGVVTRFELEGPLFWVVGALIVGTVSEAGTALILTTLGATSDHGWLGGLAAVATTAAAAVLVAAALMAFRLFTSPERRRRRVLRRK